MSDTLRVRLANFLGTPGTAWLILVCKLFGLRTGHLVLAERGVPTAVKIMIVRDGDTERYSVHVATTGGEMVELNPAAVEEFRVKLASAAAYVASMNAGTVTP